MNFVEPNSEKEYELNIASSINEDLINNNNNIFDKNFINKDFTTYGYELTPERILKIKQINSEKILKEKEKEIIKKEKIKKVKRPTSSIFISQNKKYMLYRNNDNDNKNIKYEESKNQLKDKIKSIFENNKNNSSNKIYNLLDTNNTTRNNLQLDLYTQTNVNTDINIECLGDSLYKNKLDWNLISESDRQKGKILWKKLNREITNTSNKSPKNKDNKNENIIDEHEHEQQNNLLKIDVNKNKENYKTRNNSNPSTYSMERINSANFINHRKELNNYKINEESEDSDDMDEPQKENNNLNNHNLSNNNKRKKHIRFSTQKIDKINNMIKYKNDKRTYNRSKYSNLYNNSRIIENEEEIEEEEEEEDEEEYKENSKGKFNNISKSKKNLGRSYIIMDKDKNKKRKKNIGDGNKYVKFYKRKSKTKIISKNKLSKKGILSLQKMNKNYLKNKNQDLLGLSNYIYYSSKNKKKIKMKHYIHNYKIKVKFNSKKKNKKHKNKDKSNKDSELNETNVLSLNSSDYIVPKSQSLIIDNNIILKNLNSSNIDDEEKLNISDEENENLIIKKFSRQLTKLEKNRETNPAFLFDKMVKNFQYKYKEDDETNGYYNELFSKYGKESNDEDNDGLVNIKLTLFGLNLKITKKAQNYFYNKFISDIKIRNRIKREQNIMNERLSIILDRFNKKKINEEEIQKEKLNKKRTKRRKTKTNFPNKNTLLNQIKEENIEKNQVKGENEYEKDFFWGIKIDSVKELEKKKEEVLLRLKHDIKYKIKEGVFNQSEMDNFLKFQKRINELTLEKINNRVYIKQLEQGFNSFEEELKMHEEKKKNERRINNFVDSMNFDLYRKLELKKAIEKYFCHPIDFKNKNLINILSPFRIDENKQKI